jgi:hypothetical protein
MPIRVKCEKCKKTLSVKDHLAGKKIKCPVCQSVVGVPMASPTKEPPTAPKAGIPAAPKPVPKASPAAPTAAKKPAVAAKPVAKAKSKPESNGVVPPTNGEKTNGKAPPPEPAPIELPPENVEEEALSALADEPPPPEETQAPKTIDFKCQWCDEEVKLPIAMAGKQAQCPNAECKRIIKVPLPKTPEKKDWRKMERQGPAAAKINLPDALDNAWGTEEATRARQDSLAQAGAVDAPAKPPLGVFGWLRRGFYVVGIVAAISAIVFGGSRLMKSNEKYNAVKEIEQLLKGRDVKITEKVLKAEAHRTIAVYYLYGHEQKAAKAWVTFEGARSFIDIGDAAPPLDKPALNEQFFLIDLALSQIEAGGSGDDVRANVGKRKEWKDVQPGLKATLDRIQTPEIRVIALREVAARLFGKDQKEMAIALAGSLSGANPANGNRPTAYRQQIALVYAADKLETLGLTEPDLATKDPFEDGNLRVGFAEGYARKGKFDEAFKLANLDGPEEDQIDALLGIAAVALLDKNKEKSTEAFKAALEKAKNPKDKSTVISPWQWLALARLGSRLDDKDAVKEAVGQLPPPFKLRAHLEVFLALCDKSTTPVSPDALADLVADDKEGITLALAWMALARQHARTGDASRKANLKTYDNNLPTNPLIVEVIRPMVVVGTYQRLK